MFLVVIVVLLAPYLKNRLPDGWTDPWIIGWQCRQPWLKAYRDWAG
jgi:hypothetical protein